MDRHDENTYDAVAPGGRRYKPARVPLAAQRKLLGDNARRLYGIEPLLAVEQRVQEYEPAILPW